MLQLDLTLGGGTLIRESPTRQSLGQTQITDLGGGQFRIDSFFDVFTELSVDGGQTWLPSTDASDDCASDGAVESELMTADPDESPSPATVPDCLPS